MGPVHVVGHHEVLVQIVDLHRAERALGEDLMHEVYVLGHVLGLDVADGAEAEGAVEDGLVGVEGLPRVKRPIIALGTVVFSGEDFTVGIGTHRFY